MKGEKAKSEATPRKATTTVERENQIIALAYDEAERQIRAGTASSQVITHFLKMGSERERLEKELVAEKSRLAAAKVGAIEAEERIEQLYVDAITAMRRYSGQDIIEDEPDD